MRVAKKNAAHVQTNCAATADNTAKNVWGKKTGVITVIHAGIVPERFVHAEMDAANAVLCVKAVKNSVKIVRECFVMSAATVSTAWVIPVGAITATCVENVRKYVSVEVDVPTVQRFARNVMKNVPIAGMLKFAEVVMCVKTVQVERVISVIVVRPASIVHPIFAIAETVVPNVPRFVKAVRNSAKTVPERFVPAVDIVLNV